MFKKLGLFSNIVLQKPYCSLSFITFFEFSLLTWVLHADGLENRMHHNLYANSKAVLIGLGGIMLHKLSEYFQQASPSPCREWWGWTPTQSTPDTHSAANHHEKHRDRGGSVCGWSHWKRPGGVLICVFWFSGYADLKKLVRACIISGELYCPVALRTW